MSKPENRGYNLEGKYPWCNNVYQAMDPRHVFWVYDVLCTGKFKKALEIGSHQGTSSTAFLEAIDQGKLEKATICDLKITPELHKCVYQCRFQEKIEIFEGDSIDALKKGPFDFVLVDGDHRYEQCSKEIAVLLEQQPLVVMAHDTSFFLADGSPMYKSVFQATPGYTCFEDNQGRRGERTWRGLFLATRIDPEIFRSTYLRCRGEARPTPTTSLTI